MIDRATIDRILDAVRIEEVISDFVALKRRGGNYVACCPFHHEKTPSFSVSPAKGIFKCFGCGKAGSAVTFIMEHEQMGYAEALKYLGRKYGIEVHEKEETAEDVQERLYRESLLIVNDYARQFFTDALWERPEGQAIGLSYFRERGFTDQTIRKFQLGYSPEHSGTFSRQALKAGYKKEHLTAAGLCIERERTGELFDRFYGRVMFPIRSISGKTIAFGGRKLRNDNKEIAKYINSPESEVYVKSNSLYGIFEAKAAIVRERKCYLVEGYTDVISFHQAGVENVVASSGTSLTTGQIGLIKRFTDKVTVLYDGDFAGIKASLRGIDMLLGEGLEVKAALFPDGEDPDSYARSHTADQLRSFLTGQEEDFISFKYRILSRDIQRDPIQRARLIADIVGSIAVIPDAIVRNVYIEDTAARLHVGEDLLQQEVAKVRRKKQEDAYYSRLREERAGGRSGYSGSGAASSVRHPGPFPGGSSGRSGFPAPPGGGSPASAATDLPGSPENAGPARADSSVSGTGIAAAVSSTPRTEDLPGYDTAMPAFVENTYCEEAEKEILYYLIKFGHLPIHLEEQFVYGAPPEQEQTVAQYILEQLQNDDLELQNLLYKHIFDEYFRLEETDGEKILRHFIHHPDPAVSQVVLDMTIQPYTLTIKQFTKSLIPERNILGKAVPKSILIYKAKITAQAALQLTEELGRAQQENGDPERMKQLMEQLNTLMQVRNVFAKELNRLTF